MLGGMFDNDMNNLDKLTSKPTYKCIRDYDTIKVGDIATVEIKVSALHNSICVTAHRHSYFISSTVLDTHFIKEV